MAKYELVPSAFTGDTDESDALVFWVESPLEPSQIEGYIKQELGSLIATITALPEGFEADFLLPKDIDALRRKVRKSVAQHQTPT